MQNGQRHKRTPRDARQCTLSETMMAIPYLYLLRACNQLSLWNPKGGRHAFGSKHSIKSFASCNSCIVVLYCKLLHILHTALRVLQSEII